MATLSPAPSSLGLWSPQLAPWFSTDVSLPAADDSLAVHLTGLTSDWLPPARGILSLFVATSPRPAGIAALRKPDGSQAFDSNSLVAVFRLLSEVEERLHALSAAIPSASGSTGTSTVPTRPRVRWLAMELASTTTIATLANAVSPAATGSDGDKAATLGLKISGANLANGDDPMRDMKAPKFSSGTTQEKLLAGSALGDVHLWAFDSLGHALDPGAVASWWSYLAGTAFDNLWVDDVGSSPRTASATAALTAALVNPHGGPPADPLMSRLNLGNAAGTGVVRTRSTGTGAFTVAFTAAPTGNTPDGAPVPLVALLPEGRYDSTVSV